MNVRIRTSDRSPTLAQGEFIRRRLDYALKVNAAAIRRVDAWLLAIDRGEMGPAYYCKVDVTLDNGERVSSDGTEKDFYLAVHRAADRVGWVVARSLGRHQRRLSNQIASTVSTAARPPQDVRALPEAV